jgi:tetratricopeptide (TPR) repeat protein
LGVLGFGPVEGMTGRAIGEICGIEEPQKQILFGNEKRGGDGALGGSDAESANLDDELAALTGMGYSDPVVKREAKQAVEASLRRGYHLARVFLGQGRAAEAIPLLERLASDNAGLGVMGLYLAHAYRVEGRMAECRALCERLLAASPDWVGAPVVRAQLAIAEGDAAEAQRQMRSLGDVGGVADAMGAGVWVEIAEYLLDAGDRVGAEAGFRAAMGRNLSLAAGHEGLARVLLAQGRPAEAAEAALDAVRLRYEFTAAHRTLGEALGAMGRVEAGKQALARAEELAAVERR